MIRECTVIAVEKSANGIAFDVLEIVKSTVNGPVIQRHLYHGDMLPTTKEALENVKSQIQGKVIWRLAE